MECLINGYVPAELMINGKVISGCAKGGEVVYRKKNAVFATNYGDEIITTNDTVYAQIKNLNIYGKSTVEDDIISSVGDSGSIMVASNTGANLLDIVETIYLPNAVVYNVNNLAKNSDVILHGIMGSGYYWSYVYGILDDDTYETIVANVNSTKNKYFNTGNYNQLQIKVPLYTETSGELMLQLGTTSADIVDYEPYQGSTQTLTLTEPLRGVPTTKTTYANYTDSDGQMWISDYIDVEEGLRYYRCMGGEVTGATGVYRDFNDYLVFTLSTIGSANHIDTINNYFENQNNINIVHPTAEGIKSASGTLFCSILKSRLESEDIEGFNTWLADNPISYVGSYYAENQIPSPVAIDTTALKKLRSYAGQTNLFVSDNAGLKADFRTDSSDKVIKGYILDYIESTGTQWIDTGIYPCSNWKIKTIDKTTSWQRWRGFWGWWTGQGQCTKWGFATTSPYYFLMSDNADYTPSIIPETFGNKAYKQYDNGTFTENEQIIKTIQNTNNLISLKPLLIFNSYSSSGGLDYNLATKLYTFFVENKEQENIFAGVPYQTLDGTICMYDTVTNTTFVNQGTGEFLGGEIIGYITEDNIAYNNDGTLYNPNITTAVMSLGVEPAETQTLQLAQLEELGVTI